VIHGVRVFTPLMLASAKADPNFEGHIINTASMAGLLTPPAMGIYNVSKHAVVALSETLYHDLSLVEARIGVSVLCPYFVPTGISQSDSVRPADMAPDAAPTRSQKVSQAMLEKAVSAGKVSAAEVAQITFDAIRARQFYIYSHPQALGNVERRMQDILHASNPSDPYEQAPKLREQLRAGLIGD
jgi:short-subunit dehydrogenase